MRKGWDGLGFRDGPFFFTRFFTRLFFLPFKVFGMGGKYIYILLGIPCIGWGGIEEYRNNAFTEI